MSKELKERRIPVMMTAAEVDAIDDWMFARRIRSRGEAIRRLCQFGMETERTRTSDELFHHAITPVLEELNGGMK